MSTSRSTRNRCSWTCACGREGRGLPGQAGVRGRRPARRGPRPVHHDGRDGRGRLRAGRAQGHPVAPAPRLRDGHLHHRRHLRCTRTPTAVAGDHQRRHPVDDGRVRGSCTSRRRRRSWSLSGGCSTACSCGSTSRAATKLVDPALPGPRAATRSPCSARPTAARWCGHRRGGRRPPRAGRDTHTPITMVHATLAPGPGWTCRGADFNALVYVMSGRGTVVGPERRRRH
jgi:hypothetical protein